MLDFVQPDHHTNYAMAMQPTLAPVDDGSGVVMEEQQAPVQHVITEEEVGEYKEQDRYLPVRSHCHLDSFELTLQPDRQCLSYHESFCP